jgi:hypothetical protein
MHSILSDPFERSILPLDCGSEGDVRTWLMPKMRMNTLKSLAMNYGPLSEIMRGGAGNGFLACCSRISTSGSPIDSRRHPIDDITAGSIEVGLEGASQGSQDCPLTGPSGASVANESPDLQDHGVNGTYNGGITQFNLFVDAETAAANGVQLYAFTGSRNLQPRRDLSLLCHG